MKIVKDDRRRCWALIVYWDTEDITERLKNNLNSFLECSLNWTSLNKNKESVCWFEWNRTAIKTFYQPDKEWWCPAGAGGPSRCRDLGQLTLRLLHNTCPAPELADGPERWTGTEVPDRVAFIEGNSFSRVNYRTKYPLKSFLVTFFFSQHTINGFSSDLKVPEGV